MRTTLLHGLAVGCAICACIGTASAQTIYDFDNPGELWRYDFGGPGDPIILHDPAEGSPGNPAGAMKLIMPFTGSTFAFTGDAFFPATDLSAASELLFDVKVDTSASTLDAFGNYGFMNFVSRETDNYNWGGQFGANLPAVDGWQTFSVDPSSMTATRAFTFQLYGGPDQNIFGAVELFIDNVRLIPEPSSAALIALALCSAPALGRRPRGS